MSHPNILSFHPDMFDNRILEYVASSSWKTMAAFWSSVAVYFLFWGLFSNEEEYH